MRISSKRLLSLLAGSAVVAATLTPGTAHAEPSDDCWENVAYIGSGSLLAVKHRPYGPTTWICVYAGGLFGFGYGGKLVVTGIGLVPRIDAEARFCPTSADVVAGQLGDPGNPSTYVPYRVAVFVTSYELSLCAVVGTTALRVTWEVTDQGPPTVNFVPNAGVTSPPPVAGGIPAGPASSYCNDGSAEYNESIVWYSLYGGFQGFVQTVDLLRPNVCYRTVTPSGAFGGRVTFSAGTYDIWLPAGSTSPQNCTTTLSSTTAPVQSSLRVGSSGSQTFLCASVAGFQFSVVAQTNARPPSVTSAPSITHTRD